MKKSLSTEEKKEADELEKELAFYRNQTKVLREKNRDLRNALLVAEASQGRQEPEETAEESLSDIRKIIADSKKQITEKLSQFKETIDDGESEKIDASATPPTAESKVGAAPTAPVVSTKMDAPAVAQDAQAASAEVESLKYQVDYLKKEIDRIETFLEQSEMVNNRLRQLLAEHNIDVSEISKAINEASKTAISPTAIKKEESKPPEEEKKDEVIPEPVKKEPVIPVAPKKEEKPKELDPTVAKLFNEFKAKITGNISEEDIKMEILDLREKLMDYIPHSRVFYEMQVEYRKWKRGTSNVQQLQKIIKNWEQTIIDTTE